jgi:hypothetical protein
MYSQNKMEILIFFSERSFVQRRWANERRRQRDLQPGVAAKPNSESPTVSSAANHRQQQKQRFAVSDSFAESRRNWQIVEPKPSRSRCRSLRSQEVDADRNVVGKKSGRSGSRLETRNRLVESSRRHWTRRILPGKFSKAHLNLLSQKDCCFRFKLKSTVNWSSNIIKWNSPY